MKLQELALLDRPRERLERVGVGALSAAELLAIILKTGTVQENVLQLAQRVLAGQPERWSLQELQSIKGIGKAKACQILALYEFRKRKFDSVDKKQVSCAEDAYHFVLSVLPTKEKECFIVLHLDTKNKIVHHEVVSIGTLDASLVHPREIFRSALKQNVRSIILAHNHPSGDPTPSAEDLQVTQQLVKAGNLLGIAVLDHVIVGEGKWWGWKGS